MNEKFYLRLFELMDKEGLWSERLLLSGQLPRHESLDKLSQTILERLLTCSLPQPIVTTSERLASLVLTKRLKLAITTLNRSKNPMDPLTEKLFLNATVFLKLIR